MAACVDLIFAAEAPLDLSYLQHCKEFPVSPDIRVLFSGTLCQTLHLEIFPYSTWTVTSVVSLDQSSSVASFISEHPPLRTGTV